MEAIAQLLYEEFRQNTKASDNTCWQVARRLSDEVHRICKESQRIQNSGDVEQWQKTLAEHRSRQCLAYYRLGSQKGRLELQSTLSAMVYRYINPGFGRVSYQQRINLIEDFLQNFYAETLNAWRRENLVSLNYSPRTLLELSEYMAFSERYAKRRIALSRGRSQQLVILRAQTFSKQQPQELNVDMGATESSFTDSENNWENATIQQLRHVISSGDQEGEETQKSNLRETIIKELIQYLEDKNQSECVDYFVLRLKDLSASEIEEILGLDSRQRDYLQQRFKYHLVRFALSHSWELVHQWLEADLDKNLGLTPQEWQHLQTQLSDRQNKLLLLKKKGFSPQEIGVMIGLTPNKTEKEWVKVLELAWELRNQNVCS